MQSFVQSRLLCTDYVFTVDNFVRQSLCNDPTAAAPTTGPPLRTCRVNPGTGRMEVRIRPNPSERTANGDYVLFLAAHVTHILIESLMLMAIMNAEFPLHLPFKIVSSSDSVTEQKRPRRA